MLLKIKQSRFSNNYTIFEKISQVSYRDGHETFYRKDDLPQEIADTYLMVHEYGSEAEKYGDVTFGEETNTVLQLNRISFVENGAYKTIWFDGDGYLCNDDGKTIHRFERGGVVYLGERPTEQAA